MWYFQNARNIPWTQNLVLFIAFIVRLILIVYASLHDYLFKVNFTDIDYVVFSDAAHHVYEGRSPYERATYRYTPILAWLLVPNVHIKDFGKVIFCLADIAVGWLLFKMMKSHSSASSYKSASTKEEEKHDNSLKIVSIFWLANPLTAVISSRGNADVLVCVAVLLTLYLLRDNGKYWLLSALIHGIAAVHLKIYPLIYFPSIFISLSSFASKQGFWEKLNSLIFNFKGYLYVFISLSSLIGIVSIFYKMYGETFLDEFILYHIRRTDTRHNFSPYFLPLYLIGNGSYLSRLVGLAAFLPQILSILYFAFKYYDDLPFCWFLTTFAFVTFNKVCTSQYFVWYIVFIPLICQRNEMSIREVAFLISIWLGGQGVWLFFAYLFEFEGYNVFNYIWGASLLFLLINCYILRRINQCYSNIRSAKNKQE